MASAVGHRSNHIADDRNGDISGVGEIYVRQPPPGVHMVRWIRLHDVGVVEQQVKLFRKVHGQLFFYKRRKKKKKKKERKKARKTRKKEMN